MHGSLCGRFAYRSFGPATAINTINNQPKTPLTRTAVAAIGQELGRKKLPLKTMRVISLYLEIYNAKIYCMVGTIYVSWSGSAFP